MIFEEDILIHKEFEKEGTHILDIKKYKNALKNAKIFKYDKNIKELTNEEFNRYKYFRNKGFKINDQIFFINDLIIYDDRIPYYKIDSLHFKFFKDLTNDQMIELRNILINFGNKHNAFQFQYDDWIIFSNFANRKNSNKRWDNYNSQFWKFNDLEKEH